MACNLTAGRLVDCKDQIGGLIAVYFVDTYANNIEASSTIANLEMTTGGFTDWSSYGTTSGSTQTLFKYDLRPNLSSMTINTNGDPATGTSFWTQTLSLTLQKLNHDTANELKLITYNRAQIFVEDSNHNCFLLGMENGCDMTGGTIVTGAGKGDLSGYTWEFTAEERYPVIQLAPSAGVATTKAPFDGLYDEDDISIVSGT